MGTQRDVRDGGTRGGLSSRDVTKFRVASAILSYVATDRPDLAYAAKEISNKMADLRKEDLDHILRVARHMLCPEFGRVAQRFEFVAMPSDIQWLPLGGL